MLIKNLQANGRLNKNIRRFKLRVVGHLEVNPRGADLDKIASREIDIKFVPNPVTQIVRRHETCKYPRLGSYQPAHEFDLVFSVIIDRNNPEPVLEKQTFVVSNGQLDRTPELDSVLFKKLAELPEFHYFLHYQIPDYDYRFIPGVEPGMLT